MSQIKKTQNRSGNGVSRKARTVLRYYDYNLLAGVVLLTCFGLVMIYSTSAYQSRIENNGNDMYYFMKQARISAVCLVGALIFSQIDYHKLMKYAPWLYVAANGLMMLTKFCLLYTSRGKTGGYWRNRSYWLSVVQWYWNYWNLYYCNHFLWFWSGKRQSK